MSTDFPATARWLSDIAVDRRRAYEARMTERGLKRVSVLVPIEHTQSVKVFGRLLRNCNAHDVAQLRQELENYLTDCWRCFDDDIAAGIFAENCDSAGD